MNLATILDQRHVDSNTNIHAHGATPTPLTQHSTPSSTGRGRSASNAGVMSRKCAYCDRRFSKAEHLKRHQRSHTGEKPFKCNVCLKSYARSDVLIRHTRNHHSDVADGQDDFRNGKGKVVKSPGSQSSGSMDEELDNGSRDMLQQNQTSQNQPPAIPLQTHSELQSVLMQPNHAANSRQMAMPHHQIPAQSPPRAQSLHRMSSQHDGSCLIEAAMQAAGPMPTSTHQPVHQKPTTYHMPQQSQTPLHFSRNYQFSQLQEQPTYATYAAPYPDLSQWLEACDTYVQPLPYGLDIWGDSTMMDFMGTESAQAVPTPRARYRPSFTRDVPDERFQRVERIWPLRRSTAQSTLGLTLWDQVIAHDQDSLFSESGLNARNPYTISPRRPEVSRWGLGEQCRARLARDFESSQNSNNSQDSLSSRGSGDGASDPSISSKFPPAEVLDMSLDLYFRRFHAFLPFAHRATFNAARTPTSLLLPMCLIGLEVLDSDGSRKFIKAYLPNAVQKVRNELTARALPSCHPSQLLTTLASAMLILQIAATNLVPGLEEQVHCLYSEAISLAQRRGLFAAFNGQQISIDLLRQGRNEDAAWKAWCRVESAKRVIVCLIMCDSFWANILDTVPIIRVDNLGFSIPCSTELFEVPNARKWNQLASTGTAPIITQVTGVNIDTNSLPALDTELAMQGFLAGLWLRLAEARHRLLLPFRHNDTNLSTQRPLIPLPIYALDPTASSIVPLLVSIPLVYHPLVQNSNPNILAWWHSQCMCLLADLSLFELAAGREGPDRAKHALESISIWAQTPAARRACIHAAQTFALMSARRISDGTTSHSEIALFHGALVLGLYLFTVHDEDALPAPQVAMRLEDEELFELLDPVDWRSIGAEGMTVETVNPGSSNTSSIPGTTTGLIQSTTPLVGTESPAKRFIMRGGTVTFNGAMHKGGYNSSRRILLDYANLMKSVTKWNVRGYCRILRIMSDTLVEVDDGSGSD